MLGLPDWGSVAGLEARARAMYRALFHRARVEQEMREEFQHHLAERAETLVRAGLTPDAANARARREFGHEGSHREEARAAMGLASFAQLRFSWLDVKLGFRMLPKHPMLNLAAVFALAVGIPVGLAPSHLARALEAPLPGDSDNRVRAIRHWDPLSAGVAPTWDGDFTFWAQTLRSFSSLGAFRTSGYNVASADGRGGAAPAAGAQLSSSVFQMLGTRPLLGRVLEAADFAAGAPDVVVIGHSLWSSRFGQDPEVLGRSIRIGRNLHVVVGVMPDGFAFPTNEALWLPLRLTSVGGLSERMRVQVLGRLADGVSAHQAQAEISSHGPPPPISVATASEARERARLRAEVVPFGLLYLGLPAGGLASLPEFRYVQALMFVLLLVACGNVAMLVFARTATRLRELAIRTALGASRARIISQIFVEALLLAVIAAGVGVLVFDWALDHVNLAGLAGESQLPYWLSLGLTGETVLSALAFAAVSATVAGVLPAIVITGRGISQNIRVGSRVRFGRLTGALVVADIAVSVAAVGMAFAVSGHATDLEAANRATGIPASEYLAVEFRLPEGARTSTQRELVAALEREPGVRRVAVGDVLPRMEHRSRPYELDGVERASDAPLRWTRLARVDVDFFDALGAPILGGRDFVRTDAGEGSRVAIVNTAFVQRALEGQDPIGRRVRLATMSNTGDTGNAAWYEIVGVVGPLGVNVLNADRGEAVYLPAAPGTINPMQLAVHVGVRPASLTPRVRELAMAVDPGLVMGRASVLSDVRQGDWYLVMGLAAGLLVLVGVLIALATSGLYAMLSLSVSERTREIGIRSALGASRRGLLLTILKRSLVQIGLGAVIGLPIAARSVFELTGTPEGGGSVLQSMAVALGLSTGIVLLVGLSSCLVPTRRVLAIEAREAMHADG
ncbi:MAG: MacB-like periplasmic core domain protein [Geminicoccaceae bacterium]|nr:MacB-like periplasmic core domain protein [Geminicoccaceae bacterium]